MKVKVYYENKESTEGGWEKVSILKLLWWFIIGRIKPKDAGSRSYIRRIETKNGKRI